MICPICGENLEDGLKLCPSCGANIEQPDLETEPHCEESAANSGYTPAAEPVRKPSLAINPKLIAVCAGALLALILLIVLITSGGGASSYYTFVEPSLYMTSGNNTAYIVGQNGKVQTVEFGGYVDYKGNAAGKVGAAYSSGELYWFDQNTNHKVTEECAGFFTFSQNGTVLLYSEEGREGYNLCVYKNGKSTEIVSDVMIGDVCISPNGSAIGYYVYDDGEYYGYIYDGKTHELGEGVIPIGITDGAGLIYIIKDGTLYVQKKFSEDSRVKLTESVFAIYYNTDLTEIMVYDGEKTVFSAKGGEKQIAFKFRPEIAVPVNASVNLRSNSGGVVYGIKSFIGCYAYYDGKLVRLNRDMSTTTVARGIEPYQYQICSDGKTVLFKKNDRIMKVDGTANDPEATGLVSEAENFAAVFNGKTVFYTQEGEIFAVKLSGGKSTKVTEEFEDVALYNDSTMLYFDGDTLYSSTGGKGQKLATFDDDIYSISTTGKFVVVRLEDGTYLYSTNAKTFKVLYEG